MKPMIKNLHYIVMNCFLSCPMMRWRCSIIRLKVFQFLVLWGALVLAALTYKHSCAIGPPISGRPCACHKQACRTPSTTNYQYLTPGHATSKRTKSNGALLRLKREVWMKRSAILKKKEQNKPCTWTIYISKCLI